MKLIERPFCGRSFLVSSASGFLLDMIAATTSFYKYFAWR